MIDRTYLHKLLGKQFINQMDSMASSHRDHGYNSDLNGVPAFVNAVEKLVWTAVQLAHPDANADEVDVTEVFERFGYSVPHGASLHILDAPKQEEDHPGCKCPGDVHYYVALEACGCGDIDDEFFNGKQLAEALVEHMAEHPAIDVIREMLEVHPDLLDDKFRDNVDLAPIHSDEQRQSFIADIEAMLDGRG